LRTAVLLIALAFIALLGVLTAIDISHHGITVISALAILVLVLFITGIVGALAQRPRE
jgi:hypothetical protein